jgi:hypothetical protein
MPPGRRHRPLHRRIHMLQVGGSDLAGWEGRGPPSRSVAVGRSGGALAGSGRCWVEVGARGLRVRGVSGPPGRGARRLRPERRRRRAHRPVDGRGRRSVRPAGGVDGPPAGGVRRRSTALASRDPRCPGGGLRTLHGRGRLDRWGGCRGCPVRPGWNVGVRGRGLPGLRKSRRTLSVRRADGGAFGRLGGALGPRGWGRGGRGRPVHGSSFATNRTLLGRARITLAGGDWVGAEPGPGWSGRRPVPRLFADDRRWRLRLHPLGGPAGRLLGLRPTVACAFPVLPEPRRVRRRSRRRTRIRFPVCRLGRRGARAILLLLPARLRGTRVPVPGHSRRDRAFTEVTLNRGFRVRLALRPRIRSGWWCRRPARRWRLPGPGLGSRRRGLDLRTRARPTLRTRHSRRHQGIRPVAGLGVRSPLDLNLRSTLAL